MLKQPGPTLHKTTLFSISEIRLNRNATARGQQRAVFFGGISPVQTGDHTQFSTVRGRFGSGSSPQFWRSGACENLLM
jgi:hypothetical protein